MRNLTMMTDLYELTMMNGYLRFGMENNRACFDIFYRKQGDMTAYAVAAGLEQAIDYVRNLHFSNEDIAYLRSLNIFDEAFFSPVWLRCALRARFWPFRKARIVPGEPIIRVIAPIMEAQLLETALLNIINHQTLIATKASRVVQAARGDSVLNWPSPRAGTGRRYLPRACSRNRRLSGDKQRAHRPALRRSCRRHACTQLGHVFPGRAERFPRLCRGLSE